MLEYSRSQNVVLTQAELRAWQHDGQEAALLLELTIANPHHHLWPSPPNPYPAEDQLNDIGDGDRVIATVDIEHGSSYRRTGLMPAGESRSSFAANAFYLTKGK